jgi:hypothetical protein
MLVFIVRAISWPGRARCNIQSSRRGNQQSGNLFFDFFFALSRLQLLLLLPWPSMG